MDVKIIASIIGISGVVIAALMSSYGYVYRTRQDSKRNARKVLYLLLEIRFSVMRTVVDPKEVTEQYIAHLTKKFSEQGVASEEGEEIDEGLREMIESHFSNMISASVIDIEERLIPEYEEALSKFSEDNPTVAYVLRGRGAFNSIISLTEEYHKKSTEYLNDSLPVDWIKDVVMETSKEVKLDSYKDIVETLNQDVMTLAKVCGRKDLKNCRDIVSGVSSLDNLMDFSDLDRFIEKFIWNLVNAAANKSN